MTDYRRFLTRLNEKSAEHGLFTTDEPIGTSAVWFLSANGRNLAVDGTLDDLVERVRNTDAQDLWPDLSAEEASMNLFSVHVYEALESGTQSASRLTFVNGALSLE